MAEPPPPPPPPPPGLSKAKLELQRLLQALALASPAVEEAPHALDGAAAAAAAPPGQTAAHQHELAQLRRERDEAVAQHGAALGRERDAAAVEASHLRAQLVQLQAEHVRLQRAHAEGAARAAAAAGRPAAEAAASGRALERLQAAHAQLEAEGQRKALRIEALEAQQRVLLESYQALEAERAAAAGRGDAPSSPAAAASGRRGGASIAAATSSLPAGDPPAASALVPLPGDRWLPGPAGQLDAVESLVASHSHLALALRCAELQFALGQAERQAADSAVAAAAAEREAAGLSLLLARQQAGGATQLQHRLDDACRKLEEAQAMGADLRLQLQQVCGCVHRLLPAAAVSSVARHEALTVPPPPALPCPSKRGESLSAAAAERQKLQGDLRLMLAARQALEALHAGLQRAAVAAV